MPDAIKGQERPKKGVAHFVCGRRSKWVVVVLWLAVMVLAFPLASKLGDAQDNDAASWLPGSAESTQVLEESKGFRPEVIPAVVVYARDSGLTPADRQQISEDVAAIKQLRDHGVRGNETRGPVLDRPVDPRAAQVFVPITMDEKGWDRIAPAVDSIRDITGKSSTGLEVHITGPGGTAADFSEAFEGIDSTLLFAALGVVIVMLLITFRSPTLLLVPVISVIVALSAAQALIYLLATHADLTVNGQSAGILTVLVFGAGTDYALLLVARYREELQPARGPARGDGPGAAPRRSRGAGQRRDRGARHAGSAVRRDELHQRARPGRRDRCRGRPGVHADALPRPAGDLGPLDLLARDPAPRFARAHRAGLLGPYGTAYHAAARVRHGASPPSSSRPSPWG